MQQPDGPDVVVTTTLPDAVTAVLGAEFHLRTLDLRQLGTAAFLEALGQPDALVVAPGAGADAALIEALPGSVRLLASYSVGLDHVDVDAAERRGIRVSNTPDVLTDATADLALLLILGAVRGAGDAQRTLLAGGWRGWTPAQIWGHDLRGRRLGILGPGRIGRATARRAAALGMRLSYWSHRREDAALDALGAAAVADWETFLAGSEVLTLHCPATPETRGLIDAAALDLLPPGAVLVNSARGELVDDDAVLAALASGHLGAYGADVFRGEPALDRRYLDAPRTYLLPHIGSATHETRHAMGLAVRDSLRQLTRSP